MNKAYIFSLAYLLLGCSDPETGLKITIKNDIDQPVQLRMYFPYSDMNQQPDSVIIQLWPGDIYELSEFDRGENDRYPAYLHRLFPFGDSLRIVFNDSLAITHLSERNGVRDSLSQASELYFNESRNIYNPASFIQEKQAENTFTGTYLIRPDDLDYAISIYE